MMLVSVGIGYVGTRIWDKYVEWSRVPVLTIDRDHLDVDLSWEKPDDDGKLYASGREGRSEVITEGGVAHTFRGSGRCYLVDKDSLQCFDYADENEDPILEAPDTSWSLQQRAEGAAERNLRQSEPAGMWGFLRDVAPALIVLTSFTVVVVLPALMFFLN